MSLKLNRLESAIDLEKNVNPKLEGLIKTSHDIKNPKKLSLKKKILEIDNVELQFNVVEIDSSAGSSLENLPAPVLYAESGLVASDATETSASNAPSPSAVSSSLSEIPTAVWIGLGLIGVVGIAVAVSSSNSNPPADTSAPQAQSISANAGMRKVTIVYDENLNLDQLPSNSMFSITTGGVENPVSSIEIIGNNVILTLTNDFTSGAILSITYTDPTNTNDLNAIQDQQGNDVSGLIYGVVADGYISGAKIYIDTNGDSIAQESEYTGVTTDSQGRFFLPNSSPLGALIAVGGINTDTGLAQLTPYLAPAGSMTINPFSTLLQSYIKSSYGVGKSISESSIMIADSLGIDLPNGITLGAYNPLAENQASNLDDQILAAQVATLINLAADDNAVTALNILNRLSSLIGQSVDLSNPEQLTRILTGIVPSGEIAATIDFIAQSNQAIAQSQDFFQIAAIQKAIDDVNPANAPSINSSDGVNDGLNSIRVSLANTGAIEGDVLKLFNDGVFLNSVSEKLFSTDIARGYIDLQLNLVNGVNPVTARIDSASSLPGLTSTQFNVNDTETPLAIIRSDSLSSNLSFEYSEALTASLFAKIAYQHRVENYIDSFLQRTGWQELDGNSELTVANAYGLAAKRISTNGTIDYVISFEGSNSPFKELADWTSANASEYGWSSYYQSLIPLVKQVINDALVEKRLGKDVEIIITGHSLGGAAASIAYADLFLDPRINTGNVWTEAGSPLSSTSRIYSGYSAGDIADIRSLLLPNIDTYTFGAPSFLIEPTKPSGGEYASLVARTLATGLVSSDWWRAALNFYQEAMKSVTVDPSLLPNLTGYANHVFQFEHKNSSFGTWDDPVANIGTYDAGTNINIDLAASIYNRYGGGLFNPIALHSIDYYGESVARYLEADTLTKSSTQLLTSFVPSIYNDFILYDELNTSAVDALAGNDAYVISAPGTFTAEGDLGDDSYSINAYGVNLTLNGLGTDGADIIYFALPGIINATSIGDAVKFTITNGAASSSVTVNNWANHYVDQIAQIVETTDPWRINYFNQALIGSAPTQLNGLRYTNQDGYGEPFVMAVPNGNNLGSKISLPTPVISSVSGEVSFKVNGDFNALLDTYVYTHGWTDNARVDESGSIKAKLVYDAYVTKYGTGDNKTANIVMANWESLAASTRDPVESTGEPTFESSVTKQVGEVVADALIKSGADINKTTLIGHSLGSFVVGSAANEIVLRTGMKVKELVALDTAAANPFFPEYDIDARNGYDRSLVFGSGDAPYDFTNAIATHTSSYTVIDSFGFGNSIGNMSGASGNNDRASTADSAYLIAYISSDIGYFDFAPGSPYHNGVVAAYADLVAKGDLHPGLSNSALENKHFNDYGSASSVGSWDGVLAVNRPWLQENVISYLPPKSIGWISDVVNPTIYGSSGNDVLFFDQFNTENRVGTTLVGGLGNDFIGASTGSGVDHYRGDLGNDTFFFGFTKNQGTVLPYLDGSSFLNRGVDAYGIVEDFSLEDDTITFGWASDLISISSGNDFSTGIFGGSKLSTLYGDGVAFSASNGDLVAYIRGIDVAQAQSEISAGSILFNTFTNLDQLSFFSTPAPVIG
jgi:hypothetical protein